MSVIHKLRIPHVYIQSELYFPSDAELLKVNANNEEIFCWFKTSGVCPQEIPVQFLICGTGQKIDDYNLQNFEYFDTVYQDLLVWHVFVEKDKIKIT